MQFINTTLKMPIFGDAMVALRRVLGEEHIGRIPYNDVALFDQFSTVRVRLLRVVNNRVGGFASPSTSCIKSFE